MLGSVLVGSLGLFIIILWIWRRQERRPNLPPGPRPLPLIGNLHQLGKIPHKSLYHLAKEFGPIMYFRLGSVAAVVATSGEVAREFLQTHDQNFSMRPETISGKILGYDQVSMVLSPMNRPDLKKIVSVHLLNAKRIEESRHVRLEELSLLVKAIFEDYEHNRVVNVLDKVCGTLTNIIFRLVINRRLPFDDISRFEGLADQLMTYLGTFLVGDLIPCLGFFDFSGTKSKMRKLHQQVDEFLDQVIQKYRKEKEMHPMASSKDVLDILLSLSSHSSETNQTMLNDKLIKAIMLDIFIAGPRTSTKAVHWAMAELLRHPKVARKVQQELDQVIGTDRMVNESDLPNLPYLHAVVKEVFRLHSPSPLLLPHESANDCKVCGYDVPKKTRVLINVWAVGRDPSVWDDPLEFDPERFIKNSHIDVKGQNFELLPFGSGRRACPGITMGLISVQYTLATLLHAFDWALPAGQRPQDVDMREVAGLGLTKATPVLALATPRLHEHLYIEEQLTNRYNHT
ncbi:hypothetical protein O6H91_01G000800 [Diphasiastrum complanatum]|uniref:Uncharacterized protein n=1 Tax=Diphasiastrum complanatum TaxID=34168 RepID=A0ACC2EMB6_DIPCM|nr:hypothetical protein O6H91_01G000800 [Diphasiastrum complanatum]